MIFPFNPPANLRQFIVLFVVAEGWLFCSFVIQTEWGNAIDDRSIFIKIKLKIKQNKHQKNYLYQIWG